MNLPKLIKDAKEKANLRERLHYVVSTSNGMFVVDSDDFVPGEDGKRCRKEIEFIAFPQDKKI